MNKYTRMAYYFFSILVFMVLMPGSVLAEEPLSYKITSPVSGLIKKVYVQQGQMVKKGDLLLEFDNTLIAGDLSEAKANMNLAKLQQAEAKKEQGRAKELFDITVLSENELQQTKVLYKQAVANYAQAKNQYLHAQWEMQHTKLYARFSGQVSQLLSYPGQYINNKLMAQVLLVITQ